MPHWLPVPFRRADNDVTTVRSVAVAEASDGGNPGGDADYGNNDNGDGGGDVPVGGKLGATFPPPLGFGDAHVFYYPWYATGSD